MGQAKGNILASGTSARVRSWDGGQVLKCYRPHIKDRVIDNEFCALQIAARAGLAVPKVSGRTEFMEERCLVMAAVDGRPLLEQALGHPGKILGWISEMAEIQVRMHCESGEGLRGQKIDLPPLFERALPAGYERDALVKRLEVLDTGANKLCHGDYHLGNVMVQHGKLQVVDWGKAVCGSPAGDVARTFVLLRYGGLPQSILWKYAEYALGAVRGALAVAYRRAYLRHRSQLVGVNDETAFSREIGAWLPIMLASKLAFAPARVQRRMRASLGKSLAKNLAPDRIV